MNEQLIRQIEDLIRKLEAQRAKMSDTAAGSRQYDIALQAMRDNLASLGREAEMSSRQMNYMAESVDKLTRALKNGESARIRLGQGQRVNTGPMYQMQRAWQEDTSQQLSEFIEEPQRPTGRRLASDDAKIIAENQKKQAETAKKERAELQKEIREKQAAFNEYNEGLKALGETFIRTKREYYDAILRQAGTNELSQLQENVNKDAELLRRALDAFRALELELNKLKGKGNITPVVNKVEKGIVKQDEKLDVSLAKRQLEQAQQQVSAGAQSLDEYIRRVNSDVKDFYRGMLTGADSATFETIGRSVEATRKHVQGYIDDLRKLEQELSTLKGQATPTTPLSNKIEGDVNRSFEKAQRDFVTQYTKQQQEVEAHKQAELQRKQRENLKNQKPGLVLYDPAFAAQQAASPQPDFTDYSATTKERDRQAARDREDEFRNRKQAEEVQRKQELSEQQEQAKASQAERKRIYDEQVNWEKKQALEFEAEKVKAREAARKAANPQQTREEIDTLWQEFEKQKAEADKIFQQNTVDVPIGDDQTFVQWTGGSEAEAAFKKRIDTLKKLKTEIDSLESILGSTPNHTFFDPKVAKAGADSMRQQDAEQKKIFEEYIKNRKEESKRLIEELEKRQAQAARYNMGSNLPGGTKTAERLNKRARALDPEFTPDTIKSVNYQPGNFAKVVYQVKNAEGIFKSATFVVDRFGNVLLDTQRRFQNFGTAVARDIRELVKWSIAIAVIYGPMQKLSELTELMIKNETTLADISVTLGNAQRSTNEIFEAAADIADTAGESIDGVLEAYNLAYRAAGGVADETERFNTANKLLTDSLILSKISSLDQAEAIDVLSAALKQTGTPLNEGTDLLNKWVAVTKVANVDMSTLAIGFSVVGDAAEAAGLQADQLNAVIATIAETSNSTGKEVANAARALVAGFQSDKGRSVLESLGISPEIEGQARGFLDITKQIVQLRKSGAIDDTQFSRLTLALGGGTRRQAVFATFLENFDKVDQIASVSKDAEGSTEALDALATETDTVHTSITRLDNAMQNLAMALGEEGGLLGLLKGSFDIFGGMVDGMTALTETFGKAVPSILAFVAAYALLRNTGSGEIIGGGFRNLVGGYMTMQEYQRNGYGPLDPRREKAIQGKAYGVQSAIQRYGVAAGGIAASLAPAMQNFSEGNNQRGWVNVAGTALGGVIGGILGGPLGVAAGSNIGVAITEAFYNSTENYKPRFQEIFSDVYRPTGKDDDGNQKTDRQTAEDKAIKLLKDTTGTPEWLSILGRAKTGILNLAGSMFGGEGFQGLTDTQALLVDMEFKRQSGTVSQEEYDAVMKAFQEAASFGLQEAAQAAEFEKAFGPEIDAAKAELQAELLKKLVEGDIGLAPYRRGMDQLGGFDVLSQQYSTAYGDDYGADKGEFFKTVANLSAYASPEELQRLTELVNQINILNAEMGESSLSTDDYNTKLQEKNELTKQAVTYTRMLSNELLSQVKLLGSANLTDYSGVERGLILDRARTIEEDPLTTNLNAGVIGVDQFDAAIQKLPDSIVKIGDAAVQVVGVTKDSIEQAIKELEEEGKLALKKDIGFSTYDVTAGQLASVVNGTEYSNLSKTLVGLGYKLDEQTDIAITSEGQINSYTKDWKIVQYLLQQIEENTSQLDGVYNLPDGASMWVPYDAALLRPQPPAAPVPVPPAPAPTAPTQPAPVAQPVVQPPSNQRFNFNDVIMEMLENFSSIPERYPKEKPDELGTYSEQMQKFRKGDQESIESPEFFTATGRTTMPNLATLFANIVTALSENTKEIQTSKSQLQRFQQGEQASLDKPEFFTSTGKTTMPNTAELFSNIVSALSTNLNLNLNTTTVLTLNGKQLWTELKTYAKNDMIRYSSGGGSSRTVNMV